MKVTSDKIRKKIKEADGIPEFDPKTGFNTDGRLDMGPYNGPLLLTELELAAYFMFFYMLKGEQISFEQSDLNPFDVGIARELGDLMF